MRVQRRGRAPVDTGGGALRSLAREAGGARGFEHEQLLGGVREMVLAADHVGDARVEVVDRDGEVVEHRPVRAGDHGVVQVQVLETRLAADDVVNDRRSLVGHVQAHGAVRLLLGAEAALGAVELLEGLDVLGGRLRVVGVPGAQQRIEGLPMALGALRLKDRPLVPVELQPAQRVDDLAHVLGGRALAIGVLDAQQQLPAFVAGEQPVEQRRTGTADVQRSGGRWREANLHRIAPHANGSRPPAHAVLIGAHVSPAGGLPKAIERGVQRGCRAIQIFNQSPRMWKPTAYRDEDFAAFRDAMASSPIDAVLIHAVYLLNCASEDKDIRARSLMSLTHSLRVGAAIGASGVVLHPGSAKKGEIAAAIARAGAAIGEALAESEGCELHLENTAGAGGTLGRSFDELARLLDGAGADERLGVCLDQGAGGIERDVSFAEASPEVQGDIDAAYHAKYDRYGSQIVGSVTGSDTHQVTVRLVPQLNER